MLRNQKSIDHQNNFMIGCHCTPPGYMVGLGHWRNFFISPPVPGRIPPQSHNIAWGSSFSDDDRARSSSAQLPYHILLAARPYCIPAPPMLTRRISPGMCVPCKSTKIYCIESLIMPYLRKLASHFKGVTLCFMELE